MTNQLTVLGLALDIAGVLFLGAALMRTSDASLKAQAGTYWDFNSPVLRTLVAQRMDARIGLPLLVAGFSCQLAGALHLSLTSTETAVSCMLAGAVILGCPPSRA
jgi:hypothetical protein